MGRGSPAAMAALGRTANQADGKSRREPAFSVNALRLPWLIYVKSGLLRSINILKIIEFQH